MLLRSALAVLLTVGTAAAQQEGARPKLGLVLSGGGARGFAHIGVLQALEELRIPADCVAGTSMGAIIGALYAYGFGPDEIESIVLGLDWNYLLEDAPQRTSIALRRRAEERDYQIALTVGVRDGAVALPKGLLQGQNLGLKLDELLLRAHDLPSFDALSLPFRCVAADIAQGVPVIFDAGDLPRAVRASMALPGVFAPVEWRGRLLVDGGILNNLPVDVARAMGAERLIAVDIGTPPLRHDQIRDLLGVTSQMVALLTQQFVDRSRASLTDADALLTPDLGDLSAADFFDAATLIRIGREHALRAAADLQRFAVSEEEFAAWRQRHRRIAEPLPEVRGIEVQGVGQIEAHLVRDELQDLVGTRLDLGELRSCLERAYGLGLFELLRCRVQAAGSGTCTLVVEATEKSWGPGALMFSLDAGTDFSGGDNFTIGTRYVRSGIGDLGAEWATDLRFGTATLLQTEWFQPLEPRRALFVAPAIGYRHAPLRAPVAGQVSEFTTQYGFASFDVGAHALPSTELRFGIDRGAGSYDVDAGLAPATDDRVEDGGLHLNLLVDTLDRSAFPSRGVLVQGGFRWRREELGAAADYTTAQLSTFGVTEVGEQRLALRLRGQWELAGETGLLDIAQVGGLFDLSGFGATDLVGPEAGVASLITYRRLGDASGRLSVPMYLGASVELGGAWEWSSLSIDDVLAAGSLFLGVDSPLGPIFLAVGAAEGGHRAAYFVVGKILF